MNASRFRKDDREARYLIFGSHTEGRDSEVSTRTNYRIDALVDALGEQLEREAHEGEP